ncbi:hypothetical protein AAFF_G00097990 [Aldrovandia affinis]|uniref:Carboxylic ester hydrolase n=1 Tax=Aldrovandia affinis TaxID=143900 RepID=A0AAD7RV82_9TELE|nr:hypothetical protein AAFF_G00097990 [Aldrovandia affinis]
MNSLFSVCLTGFLLFLHKTFADTKGPLVNLQSGSLRGSYENVKGVEAMVHTYMGVPFAQPPVGLLRLAPPQPPEPWEGEWDATKKPPMCLQDRGLTLDLLEKLFMQMDVPPVSEDCLYLNIYTPAASTADSKLPVMVWIHGGGLVMGSASLGDGSVLAAYQNVVVVLIQYRLGILGFFSTGDEQAPGNFGLLDQVAALHWVQDNIHSFGGDPGSVTIFGESAGGVSVSLLLLSPLSSGLFHRAIAESGTANMKGLFNPNQFPIAQIVANMSGCDITNSKTVVNCMMQLTEEDILKTVEQVKTSVFLVTNDGKFLTKTIDEYFQNHEVHKVPFMTGLTNHEFGWLLPNFLAPPGWVEGMDWDQVLSILSFLYQEPTDNTTKELIAGEYLGTAEDRLANRDSFLEMMGDIMFTISTIQTANFHRDAGVPVYLYEFQEAPSIFQEKRPSFVKVDHGDDVMIVFGHCFSDLANTMESTAKDLCTEEEQQMERTVMAYWANFARTGSPNGAGLVEWPQYGLEEEYLALGLKQWVGQRLKENRFIFLTKTLPEKIRVLQEQKGHGEL